MQTVTDQVSMQCKTAAFNLNIKKLSTVCKLNPRIQAQLQPTPSHSLSCLPCFYVPHTNSPVISEPDTPCTAVTSFTPFPSPDLPRLPTSHFLISPTV